MAFLKIDTSGMNNRYGRSTAKPSKSFQVTEFNSPAKNRAPYIPKTEAKEGDVLSFFDDGKGKVLTSFDGGYQSAQTSKVSDMSRIDLGMTALDFKTVKSAKVEFKGVLKAPMISTGIITFDSNTRTKLVPSQASTTLFLDGTYGGEMGSFVRFNNASAVTIDQINIGDLGKDVGTTVTLQSGGNAPASLRLQFNHASGDNKLVMDTEHMFYPMLLDGEYLSLYEDTTVVLARGLDTWQLISINGVKDSSVSTGMQMTTFLPLADDSFDLGSSAKAWKNIYMQGSLSIQNTGSVPTDGPTDGIYLFAQDVSSSSELKVVDEAANVTVLSPHNFSICGGPSEDMAWAYYSENKGKKINVDMLKLARLVEDLSGEKLVYTEEEKNAT